VDRTRRAEADRRVTLRPAPETMTLLTALLPVAQGVAASADGAPVELQLVIGDSTGAGRRPARHGHRLRPGAGPPGRSAMEAHFGRASSTRTPPEGSANVQRPSRQGWPPSTVRIEPVVYDERSLAR